MYIKNDQEIKLILEGGKLMGEILEKLAALAVPGINAFELDREAEKMIKAAGGAAAFKGYKSRPSEPSFPSTICASLNEEIVHGIASQDKVLKDGDIFSIDIGMRYPRKNGYFTDTAITLAIGKADESIKDLLARTKKSLEIGIEACQVGNKISDIGRAIESFITPFGYGIVRDLVGHGVGHAVHEEPRVPNFYDKSLDTWILEPGVVIAIEPMITLGDYKIEVADDGWSISTRDKSLSAHFEHTIVITEDGPVVATRRPEELKIIN